MSKEFKQRKVAYVVGDNLGSPVVVEHIVPVDNEVVETEAPKPTSVALVERTGGAGNSKHLAKRHCGQSQRSARIAKKLREKK